MSATDFAKAKEIFDRLTEESWYGFNLRSVIATATPAERNVLRSLINRAGTNRDKSPIKLESE